MPDGADVRLTFWGRSYNLKIQNQQLTNVIAQAIGMHKQRKSTVAADSPILKVRSLKNILYSFTNSTGSFPLHRAFARAGLLKLAK